MLLGGGPAVPVAIGKQIHQAAVIGHLFGQIIMILIGGRGLSAVEAEGRRGACSIGRIAGVGGAGAGARD